MMRVLSIDYGTKRIGVAISDKNNIIALGLKVILNESINESVYQIKKLVDEYNIGIIIVGLPLGLKNIITNQTKQTLGFIDQLENSVKIKIEKVDERFTSKIASQSLKNKKNRKKGKLDIKSAQIILQDYLDKTNH